MALKIVRPNDSDNLPAPTAKLNNSDVEKICLQVQANIKIEDVAGVSQALGQIADLKSPHLRLQAELLCWSIISAMPHDNAKQWGAMFSASAHHLFESLKENPLEPELLNVLGVALFELGQARAARECFRAVLRIEPDNDLAAANVKQAKKAIKGKAQNKPFPKQQILLDDQLAAKIASWAKTVKLPPAGSLSISLAMIVKNEEEMLGDCLESVKDLVSEMIIVDTGSTDRTREIAESYGAKVVDFPWTGSFAEARNESLRHVTGDWVLRLDADERIVESDLDILREKTRCVYREAFFLSEINYTGNGSETSAVVHPMMRFWRHRPEYYFEGAIHEQNTQTMPNYLASRFEYTSARILHYGYLKEIVESKEKTARNLELLEAEAANNPSPFNRFNMGNEYVMIDQPAKAFDYYQESWQELIDQDRLYSAGFAQILAQSRARAAAMAKKPNPIQYFEQGLEYFPNSPDLLFETGNHLLSTGEEENYSRALELFDRALEVGESDTHTGVIGTGSFLTLAQKGLLLEKMGQGQAAYDCYKVSAEQYPQYLQNVVGLVRTSLKLGVDSPSIISGLEGLMAERPSAMLMAAHAFYEDGQTDVAKSLYLRYLDEKPDDQVARVGLIECNLSDGDLQQAKELSQPIEKGNVWAASLLRSLLFVLLAENDFDAAEQYLFQSAELGLPQEEIDAFWAWLSLARDGETKVLDYDASLRAANLLEACLRMQLLESSEVLIVLIHSSQMNLEYRAMLLGSLFTRRGYLDSAAEEWLAWIDSDGPQSQSLLGLANIAWAQERPEEALALAEDSLSMDPDNQEAKRTVEVLRSQLA